MNTSSPVAVAETSVAKAESAENRENRQVEAPREFPTGAGLVILSLIAIFVLQLRGEWEANPNYAFGWGVPILTGILFFRRWKDRPKPVGLPSRSVAWILTGVLMVWLPVRLVREANMDWRLLEWVIFGMASGSSLALLRRAGGKLFAMHFVVPLLFLGLAVPWPTQIENWIVQGLSFGVVQVVVQALRWAGIAAWSSGNLIHVPGSTIGVEEACSGISSLQGALMSAAFIGEIWRMRLAGRTLLLGFGAVAALGLNFVRAFWLSWIAARGGEGAVAGWHDGAGLMALGLMFAVLWGAAALLNRKRQPVAAAHRSEDGPQSERGAFRRLHPALAATCVGWLALCEFATAFWYSRDPQTSFAPIELRKEAAPDLRQAAVSEQVRSILRCDDVAAYRRNVAGTEWWIHNIFWKANGAGANLARYHSPEICFPAAGFRPVERGRMVSVNEVPFRFMQYEWAGKPVYVFTLYRANNVVDAAATVWRFEDFDLTWRKRIRATLRGKRVGAQQVMQVSIAGAVSEQAALDAFHEFAATALVTKAG